MKKVLLVISLAFILLLSGCNDAKKNTNPSEAAFVSSEMKGMLSKIQRVDEEGYFYELSYDFDYYDPLILNIVNAVSKVDAGCSAFTTYNNDGDFILARNYDYNHLDKNGEPSGLNLLLKTAPKGKLKSIAMCDAYWLDQTNYLKGAFDDGKTDLSNVVISPYLCADGMNEAGVSVALLAVDTKEGEVATNQNTGKEKVIHSVLLRYILDNAKSLEDAIKIAKQYDVASSAKQDIHMIISDKDGNAAVLEWRQLSQDKKQELYVTYTNAVTNFFVGFNDAEDMYHDDGSLRERSTKVTGLTNQYQYGYGHGYHRFNGIVSAMDRYVLEDTKPTKEGVINSTMMNYQAFNILSVAAQEPGLEKTSMTQYSTLYDMTKCELCICLERNYEKIYTFSMP